MPAPIVYAVVTIASLTAKLSIKTKPNPQKVKEDQEKVKETCYDSSIQRCPGESKRTEKTKLKPQNVPCFNKNQKGDPKEYDRQLNDQQNGLNNLTAEEYLKGREAYSSVKRKSTTETRKKFKDKLIKGFTDKGVSKTKAIQVAEDKMKALHALHNPDLIAGGKDVVTTMGDKGVNQSIGSQWKKRVQEMDNTAKEAMKKGQENAIMNVKLTRCK